MGAGAAPAAGAAVEGLGGLLLFVGFLVVLGTQKTWRATIGWLFRKTADVIDVAISIPHVTTIHPFGAAAHALRAADDNVFAALGLAALKLENGATWLFHQAWRTLRWTGLEIAALAEEMFNGFRDLAVVRIPEAVSVGIHGLQRRVRALERAQASLLHRTLPHVWHDVRTVATKVIHLTTALGADVARIPGRIGHLERTGINVKNLPKWLKRHLVAALTGAVLLTALRKLRLGWLRCAGVNKFNKRICNAHPQWLSDFLAGMTVFIGATSVVEFIEEAQRGEAIALEALDGLVRELKHLELDRVKAAAAGFATIASPPQA